MPHGHSFVGGPLTINKRKVMKQQAKNEIITRGSINTYLALLLALATSIITSVGQAAEFEVIADTPVSFRANFTGTDIDPAALAGNDFQVITCDFWTVLVNLRGDGVDVDGNAFGFYEIQLTHSGNKAPNPSAPVVKTSLVYLELQPGVELTVKSVSSGLNGAGTEYLTTTVNITYAPDQRVVSFNGAIAGDSDLDGNGVLDSDQTDIVVETLKDLKDDGVITGREIGQIIKETRKFSK